MCTFRKSLNWWGSFWPDSALLTPGCTHTWRLSWCHCQLYQSCQLINIRPKKLDLFLINACTICFRPGAQLRAFVIRKFPLGNIGEQVLWLTVMNVCGCQKYFSDMSSNTTCKVCMLNRRTAVRHRRLPQDIHTIACLHIPACGPHELKITRTSWVQIKLYPLQSSRLVSMHKYWEHFKGD